MALGGPSAQPGYSAYLGWGTGAVGLGDSGEGVLPHDLRPSGWGSMDWTKVVTETD